MDWAWGWFLVLGWFEFKLNRLICWWKGCKRCPNNSHCQRCFAPSEKADWIAGPWLDRILETMK